MKTLLKFKIFFITLFFVFSLQGVNAQCYVTSISEGYVRNIDASAQSVTVYLTLNNMSCTTYTISNPNSWITFSRQGPRVDFTVEANTGSTSRDGVISFGGLNGTPVNYTIHQAGCAPTSPTSATSVPNNYCSNVGGNISLSVSGGSGTSVHWFQGSTTGPEIGTGNPFVTTAPVVTTNYYARWENTCGVSDFVPVTVTVLPITSAPYLITTDHNNFCPGQYSNITLQAYGGAGNTLVWTADSCKGASIGSTNPVTLPAPSVTTTYYAHWVNDCGPSACASLTIVVSHAGMPTTISVDKSQICPTTVGNINLMASGGYGNHLFWSTSCHGEIIGEGSPLSIPVPTTPTSYYAWWQTDCGEVSQCMTVFVNVNTNVSTPVVQPINIDYNTQAVLTATGASNYVEGYHWYTNLTGGTYLNTSSDSYTTPPLTSTTSYFVAVYNTGDQCESNTRIPLNITVFAPNNNNYIKETTVLDSAVLTVDAIASPSVNKIIKLSYFDGLGRPMQTVLQKGSPTEKDIIQPIVYDAFGRESVKYLPYVDGGNNGYFRCNNLLKSGVYTSSDQYKFYQSGESLHPQDVASDQYPYSESFLEASPLNRVMEQGAPGLTWQLILSHTMKLNYESNIANDVRILQIDNSGNCTNPNGYYAVNKLFKTTTKNENWSASDNLLNTTEEFKDKLGQVVLKRSYVKNDEGIVIPVETYYVYDDFGLLRFVIPPKASSTISFPINKNDAIVRNLCYYYEYDSRNRMIIKQLPGAEPVYMIYDLRDRLVLSQDGNQRNHKISGNQPDPQWVFTKYDCYNRSIMTGLVSISETNPQIIQSNVNTFYSANNETHRFENVTSDQLGYTLTNSYPDNITEANLLTITYYDTYGTSTSQPYIADIGQLERNTHVIGKVTGGKVRILGNTSDWLTNTVYYDNRYHVLQTIKANQLVSGIDRVSNKYIFSGWLKKSLTTHSHSGVASVTALRLFDYDTAGRLTKIQHSTNGQTPVILSFMKYNELGQLIDKKLHSTDSGIHYLQSIDYRYNIRGWLTHINNPDLGTIPTIDESTEKPDAFGMQILYEGDF